MVRLCFVCLGNICRSPTAQAVMDHLIGEAGLEGRIFTDSAGTSAYHAGEPPDRRARGTASARGIPMKGSARQFEERDFHRFDYVLAMDQDNFRNLRDSAQTDELRARVHMLRSFDPESADGAEVPDPYYGGAEGFDNVFDICDRACRALLEHVRREHGL